MTLREKYIQAVNAYALTVEAWNTCIDRNLNLSNTVWNSLLEDMEHAKEQADKAWKEYLYKEILA